MKHYILLFSLLLSLFFNLKVFSDSYVHADTQASLSSTSIICSNGFSEWYWLKEGSNKQKITGKWGEFKFITYENTQYEVISNYYFAPQFNFNLAEIRSKCVEQYGQGFFYIHPANSFLDDWYIFRDSNGDYYEGKVTVKVQRCKLNMRYCSIKEKLAIYRNKNSYIDFIQMIKY